MEEIVVKQLSLWLGEMGAKYRTGINKWLKEHDIKQHEDMTDIFKMLDMVKVPEGYVLDTYEYGDYWGGLYSLYLRKQKVTGLYAPPNDDDKQFSWFNKKEKTLLPYDDSLKITGRIYISSMMIPEIWDRVKVPFSPMGIWQALLLYRTPILLPKFWHMNYGKRDFVFSRQDLFDIFSAKYYRLESTEGKKLKDICFGEDILPKVLINGGNARVEYLYWNNWSGLCRSITYVTKHGDGVLFGDEEKEVLLEYDCGIRY